MPIEIEEWEYDIIWNPMLPINEMEASVQGHMNARIRATKELNTIGELGWIVTGGGPNDSWWVIRRRKRRPG